MVSMEAYSEDDGEFAGPTVRLINDEEYNTIFVKVPLNIKGKFNLENNYLDYEMDI